VEAWLVIINEPTHAGSWHVLRTSEKTALGTASKHRSRGCDVKVFHASVIIGDEVPR